MDRQTRHETLRELLDRELALATEIESLLKEEREALGKLDPERLERVTTRKRDRFVALDALDAERRHLCTLSGEQPDRLGMQRVLARCDPDKLLASRWETLVTTLQACQDGNRANGMTVVMQRRRLSDALCLLRGVPATPAIYDAGGTPERDLDGRSLAEA